MKHAIVKFLRTAVLLSFIGGVVITRPWELLPGHWKPWAPLRLDDPPTFITLGKLAELPQQPETCLAVLATAPEGALDYLPLEDYTPVESCPLTNVVRVNGTGVEFASSVTLSCPLLVRWLMFEQQALQPLALQHVGSKVARIEHYGSFACRNVYGRATGRRSEHATASAFDVAAFEFEDGEVATVLGHWDSEDAPEKSAFLKEAHGAACRYFGAVLGPEYNQPHENHFHLDTGRFNICR
ncbi:MAG: extensin family protein [Pseudomonadota bacterium]|nr:extensin family protein [Pseudomonadota bacterium]